MFVSPPQLYIRITYCVSSVIESALIVVNEIVRLFPPLTFTDVTAIFVLLYDFYKFRQK